MILADTSVWIAHLRVANPDLSALLDREQIFLHDFVIGELASGNLAARAKFLDSLREDPRIIQASTADVLDLIETHKLYGLGLGWIDLHLLTSAMLTNSQLWTLDRRLASTAARFSVSYA